MPTWDESGRQFARSSRDLIDCAVLRARIRCGCSQDDSSGDHTFNPYSWSESTCDNRRGQDRARTEPHADLGSL